MDQISISNYAVNYNNPIYYIDKFGNQGTGFDARANAMHKLHEEGKITTEQLSKFYADNGVAAIYGGAVMLDVFLTKGSVSRFLWYTQLAGSIEHNTPSTEKGRQLQKQGVDEARLGAAMGVAIPVAGRFIKVIARTVTESGTVMKVINSASIRYSQSSVNGLDEIVESMTVNGWKGDPIDIVKMKDGIYTTVDNTRLLAANKARINVNATTHAYDDVISEEMAVRFADKKGNLPKTWGKQWKIVSKILISEKLTLQVRLYNQNRINYEIIR